MGLSDRATDVEYLDASRISWNAIFSGVLIVLTGSAIFDLLGMSIGFTLFQTEIDILPSLTWGTIIWVFFGATVSMYAGGWVTSYLNTCRSSVDATLSGIITASLALLIIFIITATVSGSILSTTFKALNSIITTGALGATSGAGVLSNAAKGVNKVAPELGNMVKKALPDLDPIIAKINKKAGELLPQDNTLPEEKTKKIKSQLEDYVDRYLEALGKDGENVKEVSADFKKFLVESTGKSPEEIDSTLEDWKKIYLEAKERAHEVMMKTREKVAKTLSKVAFTNFLLIIISLIAAIIGSRSGLKNRKQDV